MKTTSTITLDTEIKKNAMPIIQDKMNTNLSAFVNKILKKIVLGQRDF